MKLALLFIAFFIFFTQSFANTFSDLTLICSSKLDGIHNSNDDKLILPHMEGKITKTEGYVKYNDYIYMVANTFTDKYRFLGAYLLEYDCKSGVTKKLSSLIKKNLPQELGFIAFSEQSQVIGFHLVGYTNNRAFLLYDLEEQKLKVINSRKIKSIPGYQVSWFPDIDTYDGVSIEIKKTYYNGKNSYNYFNNPNPEITRYYF